MKMKKIIAATLVFTLSMGNTVFASETITQPGEKTAEIKATYLEETLDPATVYSVEVAWGSLEYTYNSGKTRTWNPETLMFEEKPGTAAWSQESEADTITVTNHSNTGITASFTYGETNGSGIGGSFSNAAVVLGAAQEDTDQNAAPSGQTILSLSGELTDTSAVKKDVGQVTVTITEEAPIDATLLWGSPSGTDSIKLYPTGEKGVYTLLCTVRYNNMSLRVDFTIGNLTYHTFFNDVNTNYENGSLKTNGSYASIIFPKGTYIITFDTNKLTWSSEKIS